MVKLGELIEQRPVVSALVFETGEFYGNYKYYFSCCDCGPFWHRVGYRRLSSPQEYQKI
jgi:hypothetical protein